MSNSNIPSVAVLLAAYNGEEWIDSQLNSILNQSDVKVHVFISVDLSSDSTLAICKKFLSDFANITILPYGESYGNAAKNFYRLLCDVDFKAFDFVSLADQDDVWLDDKLICATSVLSNSTFACYSSNLTSFWASGKQSKIIKSQEQTKFDFLFESGSAGCTYVFHSFFAIELQSFIASKRRLISKFPHHDWLIYAFARSTNYPWFIDSNSRILYRQHHSNEIGANIGFYSFVERAKVVVFKYNFTCSSYLRHILSFSSAGVPKLLENPTRFNLLKLVFYSAQCRRRRRDKVFFAFVCFIVFLRSILR